MIRLAALAGRKHGARTFRPIVPTTALTTELFAVYKPVTDAWNDAVSRILLPYVPSPLITDTATDLDSELTAVDEELSLLLLTITSKLRDWAIRIERWHRGRWRGAVLTATGVDLQTVLHAGPVSETLEAFVARNAALVRDVSDEVRGRVAETVFREFQRRTPIRDVAKQLDEAVSLGRKRSRRIAQDQTQKISAALDTERMKEAGIKEWKWMHSGKLHPRAEHKARDGKLYSFKSPPPDMPGELPACGCRKLAVIEFDGKII